MVEQITYDDFGEPTITAAQGGVPQPDRTSTYESKCLDGSTGLLDFGSRWYDPLVGRFTSPDTILGVKQLARSDSLNRMAFENNDPVNHTDPKGNWSWSAIGGAILGAALVIGAIGITIATGGAAAPLAATAAAAAMASGGIAGITYSFDHRNECGGKFWGGYAATVLVNAAIGGATGALGAVATPARIASATGRLGQAAGWSLHTATRNAVGKAASIGSNALIQSTSSMLTTVAHNAIENKFYGANHGLFNGAGIAALTGGATGAATSGWSSFRFHGESTVMTKSALRKEGWTKGVTKAATSAWAVASHEHLPAKAAHHVEDKAMQKYHEQQTMFKAWTEMVGSSGFVGSLHRDLQQYQSFINHG